MNVDLSLIRCSDPFTRKWGGGSKIYLKAGIPFSIPIIILFIVTAAKYIFKFENSDELVFLNIE
jgi:hypothetical protein